MSSTRRTYSRCIRLFALFGVMAFSCLQAQTVTATLSGTVEDIQGAVIAGVSVTVTNTATGASRKMQADTGGRFVANGLQPGPYVVATDMSGFAPKTIGDITLNVGDVNDLPIVLSVGSHAAD